MVKKPILYTLRGCGGCLELEEHLKEDILAGNFVVRMCDPNGTKKEIENCKLYYREKCEAFPCIIDEDGEIML